MRPPRPSSTGPGSWPVIAVHTPLQAAAALAEAAAAACPVILTGPPGAAAWQGPGWLAAVVGAAARAAPGAVWRLRLDCGSSPGHALAALGSPPGIHPDEGVGAVEVAVHHLPPATLARLAAMAAAAGARLLADPPPPDLDLAGREDAAAARAACRLLLSARGRSMQEPDPGDPDPWPSPPAAST